MAFNSKVVLDQINTAEVTLSQLSGAQAFIGSGNNGEAVTNHFDRKTGELVFVELHRPTWWRIARRSAHQVQEVAA